MWDSENTFDYLGVLSESGRSLAQNTCLAFNLPNKNLAILFDVSNYEDLPGHSIWRHLGNHLNIESGDGSHSGPPPTVEQIIRSRNFLHLIWLARRAWDTTEIDFVWNLAHELRHLEQDIKNHALALAGNFLYHNLSGMEIDEPKLQTTVPTEMDAELTAWRTARKLFGKQVADSYVRDNAKVGKKQVIFGDLLKHDPDEKYDVFSNTISLLRKYQTQFEDIISQSPSRYRKLGTVNELCRELANS
jgi:hypothetical protein